MIIKLEDSKKESAQFSLVITFEDDADKIVFTNLLESVDAPLGEIYTLNQALLNTINSK